LALGGCAVDLLTKSWIFEKLRERPYDHLWIVDNVFGLTTSLNEGALFGVGQGGTFVFAALSVVAAIAIVYWLFWKGGARDAMLTFALGCITAGILGNLYDRIGLPRLKWAYPASRYGDPVYAVRDWLHFKLDAIGLNWPVFNIADSLLVCGAGLLLWHAFRPADSPTSKATSPAALEIPEKSPAT
jgi:signal peptidase II